MEPLEETAELNSAFERKAWSNPKDKAGIDLKEDLFRYCRRICQPDFVLIYIRRDKAQMIHCQHHITVNSGSKPFLSLFFVCL